MQIVRKRFGLGRILTAASLLIGPVVAQAAVTVALAASNLTPVAGGGAFGYTVTLANPDPGAATNVVMTLPLPPGIWFENLTVSGAQAGAFSCVGPGVDDNGSVVCRSASFVAGGAVTIDVVVSTDPDLSGGVRTATARVVAGGSQNTASRQVTVQNSAALSLFVAATDSAAPGARHDAGVDQQRRIVVRSQRGVLDGVAGRGPVRQPSWHPVVRRCLQLQPRHPRSPLQHEPCSYRAPFPHPESRRVAEPAQWQRPVLGGADRGSRFGERFTRDFRHHHQSLRPRDESVRNTPLQWSHRHAGDRCGLVRCAGGCQRRIVQQQSRAGSRWCRLFVHDDARQ
ncbi:MAG: hypothetical protein IPO95_06565 [Rhodanobacteraceae bacterium]|nr:hypothetical protein [Rhodanobacteraceae bacterium]